MQLKGSLAGLPAKELEDVVLAYEPVWAIGTGRTATPAQAQEAHAFIRQVLAAMADPATAEKVRIQYGGSVKTGNTGELMAQPDIDGALVGGASLVAARLRRDRQDRGRAVAPALQRCCRTSKTLRMLYFRLAR